MKNNMKLKSWQILAAVLGAYVLYLGFQMIPSLFRARGDVNTIREIVASEELILQLTPQIKKLSRDAMNLQLPGPYGQVLFDTSVHVVDLTGTKTSRVEHAMPTIAAQVRSWPVSSSSHELATRRLDLWRPLLERVDYFEHAKFYFY